MILDESIAAFQKNLHFYHHILNIFYLTHNIYCFIGFLRSIDIVTDLRNR